MGAPKDEQMNDANHRKKEDANDPFASLDMGASDIFNSPQKNEKNEKDESAMGVLGGLLSANPEFGNNENIFGGNKEQNNVESNFVDFKKYESVKESKKFDKNDPTLTKIEDVDQYKIVSVKETIISDDGNGNIEVIKPQKIEKNELEKKNDPFSSIEAEFNSLNNEFDKIQKQQSGNDVVLDMFSSENETNENVKEENVELKPDNDPFAELDMSPNEMFIAPKDEQMNDAKHRKKEDANDPFASLDMAASDIFNSPQKKEKNEKDESAMGVLGGLLSANPEFGNNENIFGGNKEQNNVESNFVDFKKYESVKESKKFDKNDPTLTKIE